MNILFVCLGNICRSPTAEAVFRRRSIEANLSLHIDSAGTGAWHSGEPPDTRAQLTGTKRGYSFDGQTARKVSKTDFTAFDLILAMDQTNLKELTVICPLQLRHKLKLFLDFAPDQPRRDVPDPYYGGEDGFEEVLGLIESASDGLIAFINSK